MKAISAIPIDAAAKLVNFAGEGRDSRRLAGMAQSQLEGAVAIHNILAREGCAYLADEVGMGKTYVALGVVALMRYFDPSLRVLYIAPRENIQRKWRKELGNFTANNWRWADQRVKTLQNTPVDRGVVCNGLLDWARHAVRDPSRDAFLRLTSFSFPLPDRRDARGAWKKKRDELLDLAPFLKGANIPIRHGDKERFKQDYAKAINSLLPHYDLVIIDEAHNLKHGRDSAATRNQILSRVLGAHGEGVVKRFDRMLLLSATPLESDFIELWRQLDLLGFGDAAADLASRTLDDEQKTEVASRYLVRRLTELQVGGQPHTKNMYRREWRAGGMEIHDDPLDIPGSRQRLVVALVQKKVAEILQDERFGARFQIGMLASFESFLQTAKIKRREEDDPAFDHAGQTDDELEREGIDSLALAQLADSYRRRFGEPLPHPKMDAVVSSLTDDLAAGEKALVFVRRVASVGELSEKLARAYDDALRARLLAELPGEVRDDFDEVWKQYTEERAERLAKRQTNAAPSSLQPDAAGDGLMTDEEFVDDPGGNDTFFSWFFRGEGPAGFLSGAAFQKNRLRGEGSAYSTFFEENYAWDLLGDPGSVLSSLAKVLERPIDEVNRSLRALAYGRVTEVKRQRQPRLRIYRAYQEAALRLLADSSSAVSDRASLVLRMRFPGKPAVASEDVPASFPEANAYLDTKTFFTALRTRPALRQAIWPPPQAESFDDYFRERETRRELLSAAARLGHSFIDLWILAIKRIGSIRLGSRDEAVDQAEQLIDDLIKRLEEQRETTGFHAFRELSEIGRHHELIMAVNFPEAVRQPLTELARTFGAALSTQTPVGGMHGGVASRVVRQFRMPGYPTVLITTDVLQEGEDLHTFCGRIVHYGISWTPSAMEQRTGRIDRIGSLVHRELGSLERAARPDELLQVHYPYLAGTVEKLQVDRVFRRMNDFIRLTHRGGAKIDDDSRIDTRTGFLHAEEDISPIDTPLQSAFPVKKAHLEAPALALDDPGRSVGAIVERFDELTEALGWRVRVEWDAYTGKPGRGERFGTVYVEGDDLLSPKDRRAPGGGAVRQQPFALHLRTSVSGLTLIHAISPAAVVESNDARTLELVEFQSEVQSGVRVCESPAGERNQVLVTIEDDILLHPEGTEPEELEDLVRRTSITADRLERQLVGHTDAPIDEYRANLHRETRRGQHSEPPRR